MKILVNPIDEKKLTGITSIVSFDNPVVQNAFRKMFEIEKHERLVQIEITQGHITARIEHINKEK